MVSLPVTHAWLNGKSTAAPVQEGASSSPNVRLELQRKNLNNPYLTEGRKIYTDEEEVFNFASRCLRAEKSALRLIAGAEQCISGMRRKLERRGHEAICVSAVISRLSDLNFISDSRYAQLWLESRMRLARSPRRLLSSLCTKGIDLDDAKAALKAVLDEETELALLVRFCNKRMRKGKNKSEGFSSLKHLLKSEGFSPQVIDRLMELDLRHQH
jgi:regulatory protein